MVVPHLVSSLCYIRVMGMVRMLAVLKFGFSKQTGTYLSLFHWEIDPK